MRARRSGFTLLELLIVVAIIAVLATLILGGLAAAKRRTQIAVAKNNIAAMKAALQMYETDTGKYPRRPGPPPTGPALFNNDISYVYAALKNRKTLQHGGGPNSPYLEWKPEQLALSITGVDGKDFGNSNPTDRTPAPPFLEQLGQDGVQQLDQPTYQAAHLPNNPASALVFTDPWGNPYVYREWASIPVATKDSATNTGTSRLVSSGTSGADESHTERPHDPSKFDIYSFGPNGVNEYGEGDDVTSWSDVQQR